MSRHLEGNSASRTRRQQEDQRRMEFRRAIESYSEQRRLQLEISDYPDLTALTALVASQAVFHQSAQPGR